VTTPPVKWADLHPRDRRVIAFHTTALYAFAFSTPSSLSSLSLLGYMLLLPYALLVWAYYRYCLAFVRHSRTRNGQPTTDNGLPPPC